jgi:hypothetical protein
VNTREPVGGRSDRRSFLRRAAVALGAGVGLLATSSSSAYAAGSHCCPQNCSANCPTGYAKAFCTTSCGSCCACIKKPFTACKDFAGCFC